MSKQQELITRLTEAFEPHFLVVENESHMHSSGRGANSHFKIVLVSERFDGLSKVARHRQLYQFLADDLAQGIHALALHLYTKEEWNHREGSMPKLTNCVGIGH
ncbi:BolA [Pasteurella multocida]|nr:BolA [Pasteurella multocida]